MKIPRTLIQDIDDMWIKIWQLEQRVFDIEKEITELNIQLINFQKALEKANIPLDEVMRDE